MLPVNICHAWTTVEEVVVVGEHQGKSSVLRFYLHKMMGLAMSRSKCRPLGSRPARFSSQISLRRPSPRRYDACKTPPRSLSKCILKKRWPPSSFLRAFISPSFFPFHAQKGCTDSLLLPRFFLRFFSIERFTLFWFSIRMILRLKFFRLWRWIIIKWLCSK